MSEAAKDPGRALAATKAIIDGRDLEKDFGAILVTTEHAIAMLLVGLMRDPRKAAAMLNEGLLEGVENRLSLYASKAQRR